MRSRPNDAQSVCAIIVTYNPPSTFIENIVAVAAQVGQVVVIDNGSSGDTEQHLHELETGLRCKVVRNHQNLGMAAALNIGVKYAMGVGFDWVCTLDQDSRVSDGFISKMLEASQQTTDPESVAFVAPRYVDRNFGVELPLKRAGNGEILAAMTSGSVMPSSVFQKVGFFDESLYIDAVDVEFCLRARRNGMFILQSSATLSHSLGQSKYYRLFGLHFWVTNHSAGRRYYITRNRLRLLIRYASDWPWMWRESRAVLLDAGKILLAEDEKWNKLRAMARGTVDALRGRVGRQIEL